VEPVSLSLARHVTKKSLGAAVCSIALLATAACGSSSSGSASSGPAKPVTYSNVDDLVAAAKKDGGTLNVYLAPEYAPFMVKGFEQAYPWAHINATQLEPVPIAAKWAAELNSGVNNVDVALFHTSALKQFEDQNALAKVTVPNDTGIPDSLKDPNGYAHPVNQLPEIMLYNTKLADGGPKDLSELSEPQYKDKLIMDDPALGGPAGFVLASERKAMGDAAWKKWLQGIKDNNPELTDTSSSSYADVLRGDRPICICSFGDYIAQKPGTPVAPDYYNQDSSGIIVEPIVAAIAAKAPHPALAALFVNWALDPNGGQKGFVDTDRTPSVKVPGAEHVSVPANVKIAPLFATLGDYINDPDSFNTIFKQYFD
jgi:iron(III) transport system substrate-binding protein